MTDWLAIAQIVSQTGFAYAAWRLANKIDVRLVKHEKDDKEFHDQVRERLNIPHPA